LTTRKADEPDGLLRYVRFVITRNERAGIDDRWHKRVKEIDGSMRTEQSAVYGRVSRWRVRWVDSTGAERTKSFQRKPDAQAYLNGLTADLQRGEYVDPRKSAETFGSVAEQWFATKRHRKPKTVAGYRSLLDTVVLPKWEGVPLKRLDYESYSTWLGTLSVDGGQRGAGLSASRITQAHQLVGAVLKYAQRTGKVARNVAFEIKRDQDLPEQSERERRYLTHAELLMLAKAADRFETLTLVLGYCGLRFGEAVALRRRHVGDRVLTVRSSATAVTGKDIVESTTRRSGIATYQYPNPCGSGFKPTCPPTRTRWCSPAAKAGSCRSASTAGRSTTRAPTSGSKGWCLTACGTPRRHWRSAQALTSRSCRDSWGTPPPR
jgi:hypothetical protein